MPVQSIKAVVAKSPIFILPKSLIATNSQPPPGKTLALDAEEVHYTCSELFFVHYSEKVFEQE